MRRAALISCGMVAIATLSSGCSSMRPMASSPHPGITDRNPNAITRAFPASATRVAWTLEEAMAADPILEKVAMNPDVASKEFRNFSKADRQDLGISRLTPANDVNYNITARSKDGHPVAVAVRIKGDSGCEVSVLHGFAGDSDLSRDLLDKVQFSLASPAGDPAVARASGMSRKPERR